MYVYIYTLSHIHVFCKTSIINQTCYSILKCGAQSIYAMQTEVLGKKFMYCANFSLYITINLTFICDVDKGFNLSFLR